MGIVNVVAKFLVRPQNGPIVISNGEVKIFGVDDATSALLQTNFGELSPFSPFASSSSSTTPTTALSTSYGAETIELDEALGKITAYLNALVVQEFAVVSAFKDELPAAPSASNDGSGQYKIYIWTMQKYSS